MTLTANPAVADGQAPDAAPRPRLRVSFADAALAVALLWWGFALTYASGGRDRWVLTIGLPLALVALWAVRPWAVLRPRWLILGAAVAAAPVAVSLIDPTHWFAGMQAATYAYAAALFVAVRAYAVTAGRRTWIISLVFAAAMAQFAWSFVAWQGGGDSTYPMVGRFFWYNPYAAFLLVPALAGAGLAAIGKGPLRLVGALTAALGSTGIVLSTSRATMALLAAGWLVVGFVAVASATTPAGRRSSALRWLGLAGLAGALMHFLPGPPLFAHRVSALAGAATRGAAQSISQNGTYRTDFWRQSLGIFRHHPLTGTGFGSFGRQSALLDPNGVHAQLVHSGFLQPLSDGGLLLGVPFLLACALVALGLLRRLLPAVWRVDHGAITLIAAGTLLLWVHSAVDFDWSYPSNMAQAAILSATVLAWSPASSPAEPASARTRAGLVACAVLTVAGLVLAQHAVPGGWFRNAPPDPSAALALGDSAS